MDDDKLAQNFKALSDPTRIRILRLLPSTPSCEEVYNVSELAEELSIPQPNVSHHLKILLHAGLVNNKKMCRDVYYWIDEEAFRLASEALKSVIDPGARAEA
ncbi:MAG: ArsR/SmtB family transcription factor [Candidatus Sumerlaeia bacterium]